MSAMLTGKVFLQVDEISEL